MINTLKTLFGVGKKTDFDELIKEGAIIIDVRTKGEFAGGHVKGSINIPLDQLDEVSGKFKKKGQMIITCCASGMRSRTAKSILQQDGYPNVYNGGSWKSLKQYGK